MNNYHITIEPPENEKSPMYSAYCEEWEFVAEDKTPEMALIGLLDAIRLARATKTVNLDGFKATFDF